MVVAASFSEYLDKLHIDVANALEQLEDAERSGDPDRIREVREWLDLGLPDWRDKLEAHRAWLTGPEQVARREQAAREAEDRAAAVSLELDRQFLPFAGRRRSGARLCTGRMPGAGGPVQQALSPAPLRETSRLPAAVRGMTFCHVALVQLS